MSRTALTAVGLVAGLTYAAPGFAQERVWIGVTSDFSNSANWSDGSVPGLGNSVVIDDPAREGAEILAGNNIQVNSVDLSANSLDVFGALRASSVNVSGTGVLSVHQGATYEATATTVRNGGSLQLIAGPSSSVVLVGAFSLEGDGNGNGAIRSQATNGNRVNGAITLAGDTTITSASGQLDLLGSITGSDVDLTFNGAANTYIVSDIDLGTGEFIKEGSGAIALGGSNTFGAITVNQGLVQLDNGAAIPDDALLTINAGAGVGLTDSETIGNLAGNGFVSIADSRTLTVNNAAPGTFSGNLHGSGNFTKSGTGTLTLTGQNNYAGATMINGGTLAVTGEGSLGSLLLSTAAGSELQTDGGALRAAATINNAGRVTLTGQETISAITGPGALDLDGSAAGLTLTSGNSSITGILSGSGTLTVGPYSTLAINNGANTRTGATIISGGELRVNGGNALGDNAALTMMGGTLALNASETIGTLSATNGTINLNANTLTVNRTSSADVGTQITGTSGARLVFSGNGVTNLTGQVTDADVGITINEGTLILGNTLNSIGEIIVGGGSATDSTLRIANTGAAGDATIRMQGSIVDYADGVDNASPIIIESQTAQLNVTDAVATATQSGVISDDGGTNRGITKTGDGTLILTAANTYTGATNVDGGSLNLAVGSSIASDRISIGAGAELQTQGGALSSDAVIVNSGTLRIAGAAGETVANISSLNPGAERVVLENAANTLTFTRGNSTIMGDVSGNGGLIVSGGNLTLGGNNTYAGATTVEAGNLTLVSTTALADDATLDVHTDGHVRFVSNQTIGTLSGQVRASITIDSGRNLTIGGSDSSTYAGWIQGQGSLIRDGDGVTTLTSGNTYEGGTIVAGGELIVANISALGSGAIEVTNGQLTVNTVLPVPSLILNGTGEIRGSGILNASIFTQTGGTVSGSIASRAQTLNGGTISGRVSSFEAVTVQNGTTTLSGMIISSDVRIQNNGTLTISSTTGGVIDHATVTVAATGTLNVEKDELIGRLINNQTVNISDGVTLAAASISNMGTLSIGEGATLQGTGNTLDNASAINVATNGSVIDAGDINNTSTGSINFNGAGGTGTLESGGTINNSGAINLNAGNLSIRGSVANDATGIITLASDDATVTMNGNLTNAAGGQFNVTGDNMVINQIGDVTNNGDYTVTGSGVVIHQTGDLISDGTLSLNDASYTATNITIDGGLVTGLAGSSLTATGNLVHNAGDIDSTVTVSSGAYAFTNDAPEIVTVDGTIVDGNSLISNVLQSGSGRTILTNDNTYSGSTTVNNGTLEVSDTGSIRNSSGVTITGGGRFIVNGGALGTDATLNVAGNGAALSVNGIETAASLTQSGASSVVDGSGTLTLSGAYSQTGGTTAGPLTVNANTFTQSNGAVLGAGTSVNASSSHTLNGGTIAGNLGGAGAVTVRNGTTTLTGSGAIASNSVNIISGTLHNQNGGLSTSTAVSISGGNLTNETDNTIAALNQTGGAINGSGILTTGSFTQSNGATLAAGTTVNATNTQTLDGGTIAGNLNGAGAVTVQNGITTLSGDISGADDFTVSSGTLYVTGAGRIDTNSNVINVSGGILRSASANAIADHLRVHVTGNGQYILESSDTIAALSGDGIVRIENIAQLGLGAGDASMDFSGALSGNGAILKSGSGTLNLSGNSQDFGGRTTLADGTLLVSGTLGGSVDVMSGATLAGSGTIGSGLGSEINVTSGGQISPGRSNSTMTINGNLAFDPGSRLVVEIEPNVSGNSSVQVTGTATLNGGTVAHIGASGNYDIRSTYTVLSAGTLTGEFDEVTTDFAFLTPALIYDHASANVLLELNRNDREFSSVAITRNQASVAGAIESIGHQAGHPVYDAISRLPDDQSIIRESFDALTGDIHASLRTTILEESQLVRSAANDRIRHSFMGTGTDNASAFWVHGLASRGKMDGGSEAADINRSTSGFLLGADRSLADWNLGVMAGYSHSNLERSKPEADGSISNYHLGFYGGTQMGNISLRAGAAHTWHSINVSRTVAFQNYIDGLSSNYDAETSQVFSEIGYGYSWGSTNLEPFANLSYARLRSDEFTETGGASALSGSSDTSDVSFSTIGLRAENTVSVGPADTTLSGMLGWRNTLSNQQQTMTYAFSSGDDFMISGLPFSRNSAVAEAGVAFRFAPAAILNLSYQGQMSQDMTDHSVRFRVNIAF